MQRVHLFTSIGLMLSLSGIALLWSPYPLTGTVFSLAGYFLAMKEVAAFTSRYQFATVILAGLVIGLTIEFPFLNLPLLTVATFLCASASIMRIVFFRIFGYTQYSWFEPLMLIGSVAIYIVDNLISSEGWRSWALPVPLFLFQGIMVSGIFKDKKQLLNFTKGGYKIGIGKSAPDFSLPDENGALVRLTDFWEQRHLLLIFVRGDWCPGCHMMLRTYERERAKFQKKNILVMAIGPDPVGVNKEMVEKLDLDFKVLSDEGQRTAMIYGVQLAEYDHDFAEKYEEGIPLPASFLIDKKGIVQYVSRPDKVGEFLNPSKIFPIVDKLS